MSSRGKSRDPPSQPNSPLKKKFAKNMDGNMSTPKQAPPPDQAVTAAPGAPGVNDPERAPAWFQAFEHRQEARFAAMMKECQEEHEALRFDISELKDEVKRLNTALEGAKEKIDELENRSRRNNVVVWGVPEGMEGHDCAKFVASVVGEAVPHAAIQRAHRSGSGRSNRPRPIHVGFRSYLEKVAAKKSLLTTFKEKKYNHGDSKDVKLFVSDDYSKTVQKMRKASLPKLKELRAKGLNAFFVFPATIKIRNEAGKLVDP